MTAHEPRWLTRQIVDALHDVLIDEHGGSHGTRDAALIESALARPINRFSYEEADLADLAAAYAFGLVKNHGYVDGNKRVGLGALLLFLRRNGFKVQMDEAEAVLLIEELAVGGLAELELAYWLRARMYAV